MDSHYRTQLKWCIENTRHSDFEKNDCSNVLEQYTQQLSVCGSLAFHGVIYASKNNMVDLHATITKDTLEIRGKK